MLPGARTADGSLLVTEVLADASSVFVGGVALTPAGAVHTTKLLPVQTEVNGFGLRETGELCVRYGFNLANAYWLGGLPFDNFGHLCCQLNQPVSPGDTFVGGVRVGPLGGVYVTDVAPPPFKGFSDGFDGGFG